MRVARGPVAQELGSAGSGSQLIGVPGNRVATVRYVLEMMPGIPFGEVDPEGDPGYHLVMDDDSTAAVSGVTLECLSGAGYAKVVMRNGNKYPVSVDYTMLAHRATVLLVSGEMLPVLLPGQQCRPGLVAIHTVTKVPLASL